MTVSGIPDGYVDVGESFFIRVDVENIGNYSTMGGITISFPDSSSQEVYLSDYDTEQGTKFSRGDYPISELRTREKFTAKYPMIEGWQPGSYGWPSGDSHYIRVKVIPKSKGTIRIYVRSVLRNTDDEDIYYPSYSDMEDQQGGYVEAYEVKVGRPTPVPTRKPTSVPTPVPTSVPTSVVTQEAQNIPVVITPVVNNMSNPPSTGILIYVVIGLLIFIIIILILKLKLSSIPKNATLYSPPTPKNNNPVYSQVTSATSHFNSCPKCNNQINSGENFCPTCGFAIVAEETRRLCPSCNKVLIEQGEDKCQYCQEKKFPHESVISCSGCGYNQGHGKWNILQGICPECGFENEL